jgi:hypothetical protein
MATPAAGGGRARSSAKKRRVGPADAADLSGALDDDGGSGGGLRYAASTVGEVLARVRGWGGYAAAGGRCRTVIRSDRGVSNALYDLSPHCAVRHRTDPRPPLFQAQAPQYLHLRRRR